MDEISHGGTGRGRGCGRVRHRVARRALGDRGGAAPRRTAADRPRDALRGARGGERAAGRVDRHLARTTAEQTWPDAEVSTACVAGHAAPALAEAAADAQLLVVAMGGGERYEDIRLHSTALSVCTAARCPVAVVRGVAGVVPDDGPVVLGVENVDADAVAVTVAFADAQRHGTGLVVVHAVRGTGLLRDHLIGYDVHSRRGAAALTAVTEELAPWRSRHPEVPVEIRVVDLPAPGHLLQAAVTARLRRGRYPGPEPRHAHRARVGQSHRPAQRALPRASWCAATRSWPSRPRTASNRRPSSRWRHPGAGALGTAPARPPAALVTVVVDARCRRSAGAGDRRQRGRPVR